MENLLKVIMISICIVSYLLVKPIHEANACSCLATGSPTEELTKSDAVFTGKVIEIIEKTPTIFGEYSSADPVKVVLIVSRIWKGINQTQVLIETVNSSASCGYKFELNRDYLIYANKEGDQLKTGLCSRTSLLAFASNDVQELGVGSIPTETVQITLQNKHPFYLGFAMVGFIIVIGILIIVKFSKKHG